MYYLSFLKNRVVDWQAYEAGYKEAYGEIPPIREILQRCNLGIPGALEDFQRLFVFGDQDAGNFGRFQAKFDLLIHGSNWAGFSRGASGFPALVNEVCNFIHKIVRRQRLQNIGYADQRMMLNPRFTRVQAR